MARYRFITQHRKFQGVKNWSGWHVEMWQDFVAYFNQTEEDSIEITWEHPNFNKYRRSKGPKLLDQQSIIEDTKTDKYWIINWQDMQGVGKSRYRLLLDDPNLIRVIRIMYNIEADYGNKVFPWFYYPKFPRFINPLIDELRELPKTCKQLIFRGSRNCGNRGPIIRDLRSHKGVLHPNSNRIDPRKYLEEIATCKVSLSLPGVAKGCHREIECMGIGTPVIQPLYRNYYAEPLVPYKHYIPVETPRTAPSKEIAKEIAKTYKRVIDNQAYLASIRQNAIDWYDRNIRPPNCYAKIKELLGIGV